MCCLRWLPFPGKPRVASLGLQPVEGGRDSDGTPFYIVEAPHNEAVHPGKASENFEGMRFFFLGG